MHVFTNKTRQPLDEKKQLYIGKAYLNPIVLQALVTIFMFTIFILEPNGNSDKRMVVRNGHVMIAGTLFLLVTIYNCYDTTVWYYYGVTKEGLNEYHFFRYVRTIPWEQMIQVGIQRDLIYVRGRLGAIVTLQGAPKWDETKRHGSRSYWRRNRPNVLFIWDSRKVIPVIEKYYGSM